MPKPQAQPKPKPAQTRGECATKPHVTCTLYTHEHAFASPLFQTHLLTPTHTRAYANACVHSRTRGRAVYQHATSLALKHRMGIPQLSRKLQQFAALQTKVDQSCRFVSHKSSRLHGNDCYMLPDVGANRSSVEAGESAVQRLIM